jgi:predicted 2-oxoglutarate/Fe(II)-dependent dioxygenase YbiX
VSDIVTTLYSQLALSCGTANVVAEPYKVVLYQEGASFKPYQDSEKTPGMFGTLVISLPSEHYGGSVILKHQKDEYLLDSAKTSAFGTSYAGWYSDIFHEVTKVAKGYRLVLTYNLVRKGPSVHQIAPNSDGIKRLKQYLLDYNRASLRKQTNIQISSPMPWIISIPRKALVWPP